MKSRETTVNFLQIENSLRDALALCASEPTAAFSRALRDDLAQMRDALTLITDQSDQQYLAWRELMRLRMLAIKRLWQRFEAIRADLGEYGFEPYPKGRYNYWDSEPLLDATEALIAFLRGDADGSADVPQDAPEALAWADELASLLTQYRRARREEDKGLESYKRVVPMRRQALYHAMNMVDDFDALVRDTRRA
jgi:hypothetical protein